MSAPAWEDAVAAQRQVAAVLRGSGHTVQADSIERAVNALVEALGDEWGWVSEREAALYTGRSATWLRARWARLAVRGLARQEGRTRWYRRCALDHRGAPEAAHHAGRLAMRKVS